MRRANTVLCGRAGRGLRGVGESAYDVRYTNNHSLCEHEQSMTDMNGAVNATAHIKHSRREPRGKRSDSFVESFARGLAVIRAFGPNTPRMTLTQVAEHTGLTRAAARRILLTLQTLGYVAQEDRSFSLTVRILDLGYSYLSSMPLARIAQPVMEDLVSQLDQSCSLGVLDATDVVYVLRVPKRSIMTTPGYTMIGFRLPAYVSSMGRVLLAQLGAEQLRAYIAACELKAYTCHTLSSRKELEREVERCRELGYSLVVDELEEGLAAVAVPILGPDNQAIAAMNLSRHSGGAARQDLIRKSLPELRKAAAHLHTVLAMHAPH